jgi:hypothetical protein
MQFASKDRTDERDGESRMIIGLDFGTTYS